MKGQLTHQDWQLLSSYLDDQLTHPEKSTLEQRLKTNSWLAVELESLRQTRLLLRSVPPRRVPRNFTLTPAIAGVRRNQGILPRFFPVLGFSSGLATLLLILSFATRLAPGLAPVVQNTAPLVAQAPAAEAQRSADSLNKSTPMIITWGAETGAGSQIPRGMGGGGSEPTNAENLTSIPPNPSTTLSFAPTQPGEKSTIVTTPTLPVRIAMEASPTQAFGLTTPLQRTNELPASPTLPPTNTRPPTATQQPTPAPSPQPTLTQVQSQAAKSQPLAAEDKGPILGLRSATKESLFNLQPAVDSSPTRQQNGSSLWAIQAALAVIALASGAAAIILWRKNRL